jgi:hypothetical protein
MGWFKRLMKITSKINLINNIIKKIFSQAVNKIKIKIKIHPKKISKIQTWTKIVWKDWDMNCLFRIESNQVVLLLNLIISTKRLKIIIMNKIILKNKEFRNQQLSKKTIHFIKILNMMSPIQENCKRHFPPKIAFKEIKIIICKIHQRAQRCLLIQS